MMNYGYLSGGGISERGSGEREYNSRKKTASSVNRRRCLQDCIDEHVLPRTTLKQQQTNDKLFSDNARTF